MPYQFRIASPCSADWNSMPGDDRVRYCPECRLNVYNFTALSPSEIDRLIAEREGRLCARIFERKDQTHLIQNCPVGFRASLLRATGFVTAAVSALLTISPAASAQSPTPATRQSSSAKAEVLSIHLLITDMNGGVIPHAKVSLKNESSHAEMTFESSQIGTVQAHDLPAGTYEIKITMPGFVPKNLTHYKVPTSKKTTVVLQVAAMLGEVVVLEQPPTTSSALPENLVPPTQETTVTVGQIVTAPQPSSNPFRKLFTKIRHLF